jgi:hypothetical protein
MLSGGRETGWSEEPAHAQNVGPAAQCQHKYRPWTRVSNTSLSPRHPHMLRSSLSEQL